MGVVGPAVGCAPGDTPGVPCCGVNRFHAAPAPLASMDMLAVGPPVITLRGRRGMPGPRPPLLGSICCCCGGCVCVCGVCCPGCWLLGAMLEPLYCIWAREARTAEWPAGQQAAGRPLLSYVACA
jgi:hypothetical protein